MSVLKYFCCGFSLKTGCFTIATLDIVRGIALGVFGLELFPHKFGWYSLAQDFTTQIAGLVIGIFMVLCGIVLSIGTLKDNEVSIKCCFVVRGILVICNIIAVISAIHVTLHDEDGGEAQYYLLLGTLETAVDLYFISVVFSFYKQILYDSSCAAGISTEMGDIVRLNSITSETLSYA